MSNMNWDRFFLIVCLLIMVVTIIVILVMITGIYKPEVPCVLSV